MIIFQGSRHRLLQGCDTLGIRRVIAEDVALIAAGALLHALPERDGLLRVVTRHGSEDESHVVGLGLVVARIFQVAEGEILSCHGTRHVAHAVAHGLVEHGAQDAGARLLVLLLGELLGAMLGHGMGYLVPQHNGEGSLVLRIRQQSLVYHNLAARHAEGIGTLVLHEVELPRIVLHVSRIAIVLQVSLHGIGKSASHTLHHRRIGSVGRFLGSGHILGILLIGEAEHLLIRHGDAMGTTRERYGLGGTT